MKMTFVLLESEKLKSRKFQFFYRVEIPPCPAQVDLWIPLPHEDSFQKIKDLQINSPVNLTKAVAANGNHIIFGSFPASQLPQVVEVVITLERHARFSGEVPNEHYETSPEKSGLSHFLKADSEVPIDGYIAEVAESVASIQEFPIVRAKKIFDYLIENFDYDYRGCTIDRVPQKADLEVPRTATCTDFHGLFMGYNRALKIPSKIVFGFNVPREASGSIAGYHCWTEVYLPRIGWFPIDVTEGWKRKKDNKKDFYFGNLDPNRVQFIEGRDLELIPKQKMKALSKFIFPHAELNGVEFKVNPTFQFVDKSEN
jgi:transglutaminase-like putative cysteine protease